MYNTGRVKVCAGLAQQKGWRMYYVVVCLTPSSLYSGVVGVFSSFEQSLTGIDVYERALREANPHFRLYSPGNVAVVNPPDIGNHDSVDKSTRQWSLSGGTNGYVISEQKALNSRLLSEAALTR
ncbi:MAG: hypothetical protein WAX80_00845 [Minisyncoccia bacterium]